MRLVRSTHMNAIQNEYCNIACYKAAAHGFMRCSWCLSVPPFVCLSPKSAQLYSQFRDIIFHSAAHVLPQRGTRCHRTSVIVHHWLVLETISKHTISVLPSPPSDTVTDVGQRWSVRGSMLHIKNRHWRHAWLHLSPGRHVMSRDWSTNRLDLIFCHNWTFSGHIWWSANHVTSRRHHGRLTNCRGEQTCRGCQSDRTC